MGSETHGYNTCVDIRKNSGDSVGHLRKILKKMKNQKGINDEKSKINTEQTSGEEM